MNDFFYKKGVFFSEKPAAKKELAIAETLQDLYRARQDKNISLILSLFTKTAVIKLWSENKSDLAHYKIFLEHTIPNHLSTCFDKISIRILKNTQPHAYVTTMYRYTTRTYGPKRLLFEFETTKDKYLISKIEPVD